MSGISERNPYVGPRSIQQGEPLYGRSAEISELYNRLQARRIVVLHSPSGAGKSSLVQAGLIPRLKQGKFDVWKPIRVNLDPRGLEGVPEGTNRYLLSALVSLEEELPAKHRRSPAQLAGLNLLSYLETRPRRKKQAKRPVVLLFDQFEEVLTVAPRAVDAKREFFRAVGETLDTGSYWALFIIREDFLAAFAPYRDRIPTQMSITFRLDLLGLEGAKEAAEQPAIVGGRSFPAVEQLIRDLSTMQVQQPDGSFAAEQGLYVEPVQLQVVCRRLWDAMPADDLVIDEEDIAKYAEVSESLGGYYSQAVQKIAMGDPTVERTVREWVGDKLIIDGIRSQVRQEVSHSAGLDNALITELLGAYLVRTEQRAGANWFELSHDRLVEPVQRNNEAWEQEHLHPLQVQAKLWESNQRGASSLLSAEALPGAAEWAEQHAALLTEQEREFLSLSRSLRAKERGKRRRRTALTVASAAVAILMGFMAFWALAERAAAEAAKATAEAAKATAEAAEAVAEQRSVELKEQMVGLAAETAKNMAVTPGERIRGMTTALSAYDLSSAPPEIGRLLEASVFAATTPLHDVYELAGHQANITDIAFSTNGEKLVTASRDGTAMLWSASPPHARIGSLDGHEGDVEHVEFSPDPTHDNVLTVGADGKAFLWPSDGAKAAVGAPLDPGCTITAATFSPGGEAVAIGCDDGGSCMWSLGDSGDDCDWLDTSDVSTKEIIALEFSPDGERLLAAHKGSKTATLVDLRTKDISALVGHRSAVTAVAFSPDNARIATGSDDNAVKLWDGSSGAEIDTLAGGQGKISIVAFGPDSSKLVVVGSTRTPVLWEIDSCHSKHNLTGHSAQVSDAAFSADGELLATVSYDQTLRLWDVRSGEALVSLEAPNSLQKVAFSPDGARVVTGELGGVEDPMVRVWDTESTTRHVRVESPARVKVVALTRDGSRVAMTQLKVVSVWDTQSGDKLHELDHQQVSKLSFSPDGRALATGSREGWKLWDLEAGAPLAMTLPGDVTAVVFAHDGETLMTANRRDQLVPFHYTSEAAEARPDESAPPRTGNNYFDALALSDKGVLAAIRRKGTVEIWDAAAGEQLRVYDDEPDLLLSAVAFSSTGRWLAVATKQKRVWVFDVEDHGAPPRQLENDNPDVRSVAFSPDELYLVTGNGTAVTLWNLELGEEIATIGHHQAPVWETEFSADGRSILSSADGIVIEWVAWSKQRHELGCEVVLHSPTAYRDAVEACNR